MGRPQPGPAMTAPETPAAPPSGGGIPFVTDAGRLVRVLFSPGDVYGEQQDRPTFWRPWLIISVLWMVLQFLQRPFQMRAQQLMMASRGITTPPPGGGGGAVSYAIGGVTAFLTVLIMSALTAGILYLLMSGFGGETTYKKMLTVVIFTWPLALLQQLMTFVVLTMRGVDSIRSAWDLFVSLGADLLLPADAAVSPFLRIFLSGIGPLQIWGLVLTAVGLMVLGKVGKTGAWVAAGISFLITLVIGAGLGSFGMKALGG